MQSSCTCLSIFLKIWKRKKEGDVNDTSYFGHVCNFGQELHFSVLISSTRFLLLAFVRCTLWLLYLKLILGNCGSLSFPMKIYSKSSIFVYLPCPKKSRSDCRKTFLTGE